MKKTFFAVLVVIAVFVSSGAARSEITTVILSDDTAQSFTVAAEDQPKNTATLNFRIGPAFTAGAKVIKCALRVASVPATKRRADQDVTVYKGDTVGQWSAYYKEATKSEPHAAELKPEGCAAGTSVFTLKTESKYTSWEYYGGAADLAANQPRLIVTYDSPSPARAGDSTDWKYAEPASFFSSSLWTGGTLLANPVSYNGAVYLVAACGTGTGRCLYRVAGAGNVRNWPLGSEFNIVKGSFAFVTAWGRLQIITTDAIRSCDLTTLVALGSTDKLNCSTTPAGEKITVNPGETPAMGPDGSLYFKNVDAAGSIVARNPALQEIWSTDLKLTTVSPIALSANGRYAYVLANYTSDDASKTHVIALLRIDTATGETVKHEISYKDDKEVKPLLQDLYRPAVASKVINKRNVDYVFVAGNTSDTGILQLIAFEPGAAPSVVWSQHSIVATAPVLSVDGNSLFVALQDGTINRYSWYNTTEGKMGAYADSDLKPEKLGSVSGVSALLVDGSDRFYSCPKASTHCQFTPDGTLIGYTDTAIYDLSPKKADDFSPPALADGTIYSASTVTAPANPGVNDGDQVILKVILKGNTIKLPTEFKWPVGATLKLQSVQ